jgi:hypothetical protein
MAGRGTADKKQDLEKLQSSVDEAIGELQRLATQAKLGALDKTYESLDRLEELLVAVKQGKQKGIDVEGIKPLAERYIGATTIQNAGGRWDLAKMKGEAKPRPCVVALPGLGDHQFFPYATLRGFLGAPIVGSLRDNVEKYELPRIQKEAERLVRDADKEIAALAKELDVKLDFSVDSLEPFGKAVAARFDKAGREERRRLRARGGLYLGELLRRKIGRGKWAVLDDPKLDQFGMLQFEGWASSINILTLGASKQPSALRTALDYWIGRLAPEKAGTR